MQQASPTRQREIFVHRQAGRIEICPRAAIEIAPVAVMQAVLARQLMNGVIVKRLHTEPVTVLARAEPKNEPWPQSCWMMKTRTTSAPVGTARRKGEQGRDRVDEIHRRAGGNEGTEGRQELQHSFASARPREDRSGLSHLDARASWRSAGFHEGMVLCLVRSTVVSTRFIWAFQAILSMGPCQGSTQRPYRWRRYTD